MEKENGQKPLFQPICVTNATKEKLFQVKPFDALKTGFWHGQSMDSKGFKEIQVPCIGGECRFDFVFRTRPKLTRKTRLKYRGGLVEFTGFEVKTAKADLIQDEKFVNYIGFVHYLYFAVPASMVPTAIAKLTTYPKIGIVDITTMQIVKHAIFTDVPLAKKAQLMAQMLF